MRQPFVVCHVSRYGSGSSPHIRVLATANYRPEPLGSRQIVPVSGSDRRPSASRTDVPAFPRGLPANVSTWAGVRRVPWSRSNAVGQMTMLTGRFDAPRGSADVAGKH